MHHNLEQISFNAWPGLNTLFYDGWILRISDGVTRRANSISPIFGSTIDVDEKILYCKKLYDSFGLPTYFKMNSQSFPGDLDAILEKKGYLLDAETSVQTIQLDKFEEREYAECVKIHEVLNIDWLQRSIAFNAYDAAKTIGFQNIFNKILLKKGFFDIIINGKHIGCGLGVIEQDYIGLFDIVIEEAHRGKGHGKTLVENMLLWGRKHGCKTAYLQVMTNNKVALNLYKKMGFQEDYKYWYRKAK